MFLNPRLALLAFIAIAFSLVTACSFFDSSSDENLPAASIQEGETPSPLPPGLGGLMGSSPTPTPVASAVSEEDIKQAQEIVSAVREEVANSYKSEYIVVTSARVGESQGVLVMGYVVMFAVPEYFLNPLTLAQEQEAEVFKQKANEALVQLLKKTVNRVASEVNSVKAVEIVVIYPDATGVDLIASVDALLALPDDASNTRWLSTLSATPLALVSLDATQQQNK
jgi:hypothetical protein